MMIIPIEHNTVNIFHILSNIDMKYFLCIVEISVDEKYASNIEIVEDAFGDEVYYNYVKYNRELITTNTTDEERT